MSPVRSCLAAAVAALGVLALPAAASAGVAGSVPGVNSLPSVT
jgi:hypothetical protein